MATVITWLLRQTLNTQPWVSQPADDAVTGRLRAVLGFFILVLVGRGGPLPGFVGLVHALGGLLRAEGDAGLFVLRHGREGTRGGDQGSQFGFHVA